MNKRSYKTEIVKESLRIEECLTYSSKGHFYASSLWRGSHYVLGIPLFIASGLLGASILDNVNNNLSFKIGLSLLVSIFSALITFVNPNERSQANLKVANQFDALLNKNRRFRLIDCKREGSSDLLSERLDRIADEKDRLNANSPQIPRIAYYLAKREIKQGEMIFSVDLGES